jgi:hypothetical protein
MKPTGYLVAILLLGAAELIGASTVQAVAVGLGSPGIRRTGILPVRSRHHQSTHLEGT